MGLGARCGSMVFPAHAGVILADQIIVREDAGFPRTRGGDPMYDVNLEVTKLFSPHTRG